ncbi:4'-phosphopantetheinyl transferase superfamily protein [Streptomyces sp. TRM76323]|uniref:4'-phosphopantetheinyl transferase superfamily protein n=1 Tax=Streptomyces tamarix TaxID=3078565 RepID=A0ABU3QNY8_9ACTN|nr:4'-phosphopantetheinyl transferase superfamily protein [Streptomyces tamarix]MDT9684474.1 4'-phosphopantetheinyl transferase superfamily protein [Streptomyces tamarix]
MGTAATFRSDARAQGRGEVQVWVLPAPTAASRTTLDLTALDERERQRMNAFVRDGDRVLYGFAHGALRTVLSALTGEAPAALRFARAPCPCCDEPHGRPVLSPARLEFSLSHSRDLVLIGVAPTPIGVDTEPVPKPGTAEQLARMLHPAEREEVAAALPEHRAAVFARLWVRKEAYLKGLGTGLGRDLAADDVRGAVAGWHLTDLPVGPGQAAAVAVASPAPCGIRLHRALPVK